MSLFTFPCWNLTLVCNDCKDQITTRCHSTPNFCRVQPYREPYDLQHLVSQHEPYVKYRRSCDVAIYFCTPINELVHLPHPEMSDLGTWNFHQSSIVISSCYIYYIQSIRVGCYRTCGGHACLSVILSVFSWALKCGRPFIVYLS